MQYDNVLITKEKSFLHGLGMKWRVIIALVGREMVTAYGNRKLGYVWALLEPSSFILFFLLVRSFVRGSIPFGENAVVFVLTGIVSFRLIIAVAGRTLSSITANQALLTFPQVRPLDTIIARILLQSLTMLVITAFFYVGISWINGQNIIVYPLQFTSSVLLTLYVGAALGSFNAVVAAMLPSWASIWGMISLPLFILSGVFFVPAFLPPAIQEILAWNPLLHCVELMRASSYMSYPTFAEYEYPFLFATIALTIALSLERFFRNMMLTGN